MAYLAYTKLEKKRKKKRETQKKPQQINRIFWLAEIEIAREGETGETSETMV